MGFNKRDLLKHIGVSTAAVSSFSVVSATSGESDEPTEWLAVAKAGNSNNNLLAFTALKDQTLCLYLATGTSSADSPADDVTRLTDPSDGSVFDVHWVDPSTLSVWKNGEIVHLTITSNGSVSDRSTVKDQAIPPGLITTQSGYSSQSVGGPVLDPGGGGGGGGSGGDDGGSGGGGGGGDDGGSGGGGGGGDDGGSGGSDNPDWFDDPDFEMEPIKKCDEYSNIGVEIANICVQTDRISPKAYTKSCTGYEQPLFGFSHTTVSLSTPAGGGSVGLDIWAGFDPDTGCIYMGSEMANICVSECFPPDSPPTQSAVEDSFKDDIMDIVEASEDEFQDVVDLPWAQYGGNILIIVGIIILAIIAAIFSIFPGAPQPA